MPLKALFLVLVLLIQYATIYATYDQYINLYTHIQGEKCKPPIRPFTSEPTHNARTSVRSNTNLAFR